MMISHNSSAGAQGTAVPCILRIDQVRTGDVPLFVRRDLITSQTMRPLLAMPVMSKSTNIPSSQKLTSGKKSRATVQDAPSSFGSSMKSPIGSATSHSNGRTSPQSRLTGVRLSGRCHLRTSLIRDHSASSESTNSWCILSECSYTGEI